MERVRKILVPVDFSDESGKALREALSLAGETRAQLIALHVIDNEAERTMLLGSWAATGAWPIRIGGSALPAVDILLRERCQSGEPKRGLRVCQRIAWLRWASHPA